MNETQMQSSIPIHIYVATIPQANWFTTIYWACSM